MKTEGWAWSIGWRKCHYMLDRTSLCNRYSNNYVLTYKAEPPGNIRDICKKCIKKKEDKHDK